MVLSNISILYFYPLKMLGKDKAVTHMTYTPYSLFLMEHEPIYSFSEIKLPLHDNLTYTDNIPQRDGIR